MSINWHTKSQGPKKKCTHFTREKIHSCPVDTIRNKGSFTSMALWSVQSFLSISVFSRKNSVPSGIKSRLPTLALEGGLVEGRFPQWLQDAGISTSTLSKTASWDVASRICNEALLKKSCIMQLIKHEFVNSSRGLCINQVDKLGGGGYSNDHNTV